MDLISFLLDLVADPVSYGIVFFIYVVLAAIILPIPVEIGLFNPLFNPIGLIFILGMGKGVGAFIVFHIGRGLRKTMKKWSIGPTLTKKIIDACERFVKRYGYIGLFVIMSIPLMVDSITLYLFSLLNSQSDGHRAMQRRFFVLINIAAGIMRGSIIIGLFYLIGVKLV
jgi:membrane protein YqaA with SNARE-associated domain